MEKQKGKKGLMDETEEERVKGTIASMVLRPKIHRIKNKSD